MGNLLRCTCLLILALFASAALHAQESLPRRGFFGAQLAPIPAKERARAAEGVLVQRVFPNSSALASGFEAGDILTALDGEALTGPRAIDDAVSLIGAHLGGDDIEVTYVRGNESATRTLSLKPFPLEESDACSIQLGAIDVDGVLQRVFLTTPPGDGPFPTFFYLQGLGCSSVEAPFDTASPVRQLLTGVSSAGFATLRVEKSGVGDSQGTPCEDIDFATELKGFEAACAWAKARPEVSELFLFGHSMGGVFAPLVAQSQPVDGVIAYGTITAPLTQYFLENEARQMKLREVPESNQKKQLDLMTRFTKAFFDENQPVSVIRDSDPDFKPFLTIRDASDTHLHGRHQKFWYELNGVNKLEAWKQVEAPILILWGQCDVPASQSDHLALAEALPAAKYIELPNMGHGFDTADNMSESLKRRSRGIFNNAIVDAVVDWMRTTKNS